MRTPTQEITAPWWWPAVETDVEPEVVAMAQRLGLTAESASRRIWTALRMMVDPYFPTEPLKPLFPEVDIAKGMIPPLPHRPSEV